MDENHLEDAVNGDWVLKAPIRHEGHECHLPGVLRNAFSSASGKPAAAKLALDPFRQAKKVSRTNFGVHGFSG